MLIYNIDWFVDHGRSWWSVAFIAGFIQSFVSAIRIWTSGLPSSHVPTASTADPGVWKVNHLRGSDLLVARSEAERTLIRLEGIATESAVTTGTVATTANTRRPCAIGTFTLTTLPSQAHLELLWLIKPLDSWVTVHVKNSLSALMPNDLSQRKQIASKQRYSKRCKW
jgi:hypothetical protein